MVQRGAEISQHIAPASMSPHDLTNKIEKLDWEEFSNLHYDIDDVLHCHA